jgi:predicted nuclease of predicted toxin-antitoxin system
VKLLFDQNLSALLCRSLEDCFPGSVHVREVGLRDADDAIIWSYAAQHGFAIVTKDADFRQRSFLQGHPPKIVWVRLGNCSTRAVERILRLRATDIQDFLADAQKSILGLSR